MIYRADAQLGADLYEEIVVDLFAGGGGASVGIEAALGRCVDVAVNHDPEKLRGTCRDGQDLRDPAPTITSGGNHAGLVAALLVKFYGNDREGLNLACPLHTVTTKDRFGLITCTVEGETYIIVDIGMRMLQPHELYAAQGFPRGYIHGWGVMESGDRLTLTKSAQVRLCGNSVCPPVPEALVRANCTAPAQREAVCA